MKRLFLATLSLFAARTITHAATPDLASAAINQLGVQLHKSLAKDDSNFCLSPLSIQAALAMTYAGSDGQTRTEMAKALH